MNTAKNILTATSLALILIAPAALADGSAQAEVGPHSISFITKAGSLGMGYKLTVSGPKGFYATETFEDGALPYFQAAGLEDGAYKYELTALLPEPVNADRGTFTVKTGPLASGTVSVKGGSFVNPDLPEGGYLKDQVFIDDVIIQSSACVGFDCNNGESFGSDTFRLKENNVRIHFDDTSASASFPNNDWRLSANDTINGGANYFAIEDATAGRIPFRVEAGAPANTLYVEDDGDVGVKTANPVVDIHIVEGNTPTLRLEQDGSDGFASQTWDIAGNEANFFIRDVTNGSKLPLQIKPSAPTASIFVAADGDVGIGTDSPGQDLHVRRTDAGATNLLVENTNATVQAVQVRLKTGSENRRVVARNASDAVQSQLGLEDAGTFSFLGESSTSGVCLQFVDSDDNGSTHCTFNDGVMTCAIGNCP